MQIKFEEKPTRRDFKDLTGERFGRLIVLGYAGKVFYNNKSTSYWWVKCDCTNKYIIKIQGNALKSKVTISCGCYRRENNKLSHDEFLKRLNKINSNRNFIVMSNYEGIHAKILVSTKYGDCLVGAYKLLEGHNPTIETAIDKTQYFINQAREIHGEKYSYDEVSYSNNYTKINIVCTVHGEFWQEPRSHLSGNGCANCNFEISTFTKSGFIESSINGNPLLYILQCNSVDEEFYKIGITSRRIRDRFKGVSMPYKYELVHLYNSDASSIWNLEKQIHRKYRNYKYIPSIKFGGYTECFNSCLPLDEILTHLNYE